MEYVTKKAIIEVVEEWMNLVKQEEKLRDEPEKALAILREDISYMEPDIDTELEITEILFREKREPIRVREGLTICPTCRKQLKDGHSYCKKCGQAILRRKE